MGRHAERDMDLRHPPAATAQPPLGLIHLAG